jgi:N-acetylglucosaminyl-diphospho-decaprenol L-rhamnosyltransferase
MTTKMIDSTRLWIVIVNYRTAGLAIDCLASLNAERRLFPQFHTVVVDNASGDGSPEQLRAAIERHAWSGWAEVVTAERNGGFAYGNNVAIERALRAAHRPDYVMLLNPDTVVHPGAIKSLVEFMDAHPQAGIGGSLLESADGSIDCSAHNAFSPVGELLAGANLGVLARVLDRYDVSPPVRHSPHECGWVSGASLIARSELFAQIGLLDDGYFLYFEEADFCFRARKAGWQIWFVPASRVVHLEGAATGIRQVVRRRPRYWYESRRRYFIKHYGLAGLLLADVLWTLGRMTLAVRRLLRLGARRAGHDPKWYALDLLWGDLRSFVDGRTWQIR